MMCDCIRHSQCFTCILSKMFYSRHHSKCWLDVDAAQDTADAVTEPEVGASRPGLEANTHKSCKNHSAVAGKSTHFFTNDYMCDPVRSLWHAHTSTAQASPALEPGQHVGKYLH